MKLSRRSLFGAALALGAPGVALAREPSARGREIAAELMARAPFPAVSLAVWRDGGLRWSEAFGYADLAREVKATPDARFRLASVSKPLAAATALRLADRGVVDLDAPIGRYRALPAAHRDTTLRQLLAHQGGVRHYIPRDFDPAAPGGPIDTRVYTSTADKLAIFIDDPLVAPPGEGTHYSTFGYSLMSAVLESATGTSFPKLVHSEVTTPLALASILAEVRGVTPPDRVCDYRPLRAARPTDPVLEPCPAVNIAYKWAGGGLLGTAPDVARFGAALTAPGFLAPETLAAMTTPLQPRTGWTNLALGWCADRDAAGRRRLFHLGTGLGARSIAVVYPDDRLAASILTNLGQVDLDLLPPAQSLAEAFLA